MPLAQILDDVGEVAAGRGQPFLRPRFGLAARAVGGEIGHMPPHDEVAQRRHPRMVLKLSERVDRQQVGRFERYFQPLGVRVGRRAAGRAALAVPVFEKAEGAAPAAALPLQPFMDDRRRAGALVHGQMIGDEGNSRLFPVFELDDDRTLGIPGPDFPSPSPPVPRAPQAGGKTLGEEREDVEHRRFAAAVGAEQHGRRREVPELDVAQRPEIPDLQAFDPRGHGRLT